MFVQFVPLIDNDLICEPIPAYLFLEPELIQKIVNIREGRVT